MVPRLCDDGRRDRRSAGGNGPVDVRGVVENRGEVPVVTRARQADLLRQAAAEVEGFSAGLRGGLPPEVLSAHLKSAESALEEILGIVDTDDILDRVFRDFCIGK